MINPTFKMNSVTRISRRWSASLKVIMAVTLTFSVASAFAQDVEEARDVRAQEAAGSNALSISNLDVPTTVRSPWRVSYFGLATTNTSQIDRGNAAAFSYNYVGLTYRLSQDTRFSVRAAFIHNTAGNNVAGKAQESETYLSDAHIVYSDYDLGHIGAVDISGSFKVYLPTSESSQAQRLIAKIRPEMYFEWAYGGYSSLTYVVKPDYYIQRQRAFIRNDAKLNNDGSFALDPRKTNRIASLEHYLEWEANINKYFSFKPSAGFAEDWTYSSDVEGLQGEHTTSSRISVGFEIRPVRGWDFTLSLQNNANLNPSSRQPPVRLFSPADNQVVLMTNGTVF